MKTPLILTLLLLGALAGTPSSSASEVPWPGGQTPDVQCMDVYSQTYLFDGYWLVRRDSCSAQLYQCPDGYQPPAPPCHEASLLTASASSVEFPWPGGQTPDVECYMVYSRTDVEQYSVVRRNSCAVPEVYQCPYQGAPIDQCHHVQDGILASQASAQSEPNCLYYYYEAEVGPVTHVQRDSCHSENYVCDDNDGAWESDETVQAFVNDQVASPDAAAVQDCVQDWLGQYIAWG